MCVVVHVSAAYFYSILNQLQFNWQILVKFHNCTQIHLMGAPLSLQTDIHEASSYGLQVGNIEYYTTTI